MSLSLYKSAGHDSVILLQWEQTETPKPTVQSGWKKTIAFSDAFLPTQKKPKANSAQTRKISLPGFYRIGNFVSIR